MYLDGIVFIDNTYARDVRTCSTKAYVLRILGFKSNDSNMDAAHVGNAFHAGIEAYFKTSDKQAAMEAFTAKYDELIKEDQEELDGWQGLKV